MNNFDFYNPTHIIFGKDRLEELNTHVPQEARVLILYGGGSVKKYGTLDKVIKALGSRHLAEFSGIEPNPQFTTLMNDDFLPKHPIETRLFHKLSGKHRKAYQQQMRALIVEHKYQRLLWERYYRSRLIQDYISGMTDNYAWDEYRRLMAVE